MAHLGTMLRTLELLDIHWFGKTFYKCSQTYLCYYLVSQVGLPTSHWPLELQLIPKLPRSVPHQKIASLEGELYSIIPN